MILNRFFFGVIFFFQTCLLASDLSSVLTTSQLSQSLNNRFSQKILLDYPMVDVEDVSVSFLNPSVLTVPKGTCGYRLGLKAKSDVLGKTALSLVFLDADGTAIEERTLATLVEVWATFYRTKETLKRGVVITRDNLESERLLLNDYPKRSIFTVEEIIGKETKSTLAKHTIIAEWMLREVPLIKGGAPIVLIYSGNGVHIRAQGQALDDGYAGSFIRVKSRFKSKKVVIGEVIDEKSVRVPLIN